MRYEDWTFREAESRPGEHRELREALHLRSVSDYTTLYRFLQRLDDDTVERGPSRLSRVFFTREATIYPERSRGIGIRGTSLISGEGYLLAPNGSCELSPPLSTPYGEGSLVTTSVPCSPITWQGGCAITMPAVEHAVKQSGPPPRPARANAGSASSQLPQEDASRYCPVCSQRLESRRCKLICNLCGYYMSCADYI